MIKIYKDSSFRFNFEIGVDGTDLTVELKYRLPSGVETNVTPEITDATAGEYYYDFTDEFTTIGTVQLWSIVTNGDNIFIGDAPTIVIEGIGSTIVSREFVKQWLGYTDDTYDFKIDNLIPLIEQTYLDIRNAPWDTDDESNIKYPIGSDITATNMIEYNINKVSSNSMKSEHIGSYSYTIQEVSGSYPTTITSPIKKYIRGV